MAWKPLVLVVEDDPQLRKAIQAILELTIDARIITAETGLEALHLASEKNPSLVLVDAELPGLTGLAVAALMKEDPDTRHIPIIAIGPDDLAQRAREVGCEDSIGHPVRLLVDAVKRQLITKQWQPC